MPELDHIPFKGRTTSLDYSRQGSGNFNAKVRGNKGNHGTRILKSFDKAVADFNQGEPYDFVYLEFESAINFELDLDKFEDAAGNIRLASCKMKVDIDANGVEQITYRAAVYLNKKAVSKFLKKIEDYITKDTKAGNPKNNSLVANIDDIRAATLESFWQEHGIEFPESNSNVWWEIWFNNNIDNQDFLPEKFLAKEFTAYLLDNGISINNRVLKFPEHVVCLVKGTPEQIGKTLLYVPNLAEIRNPLETSDFFTNLDKEWQGEFIDDLKARVNTLVDESHISVCLLDTGINRVNPLLEDLIPRENLDAINPGWTNSDSYHGGHGTPMAGLILYGDLTETLVSDGVVTIYNHLESIKILDITANDPDLYGQMTLEAIATGEIMNPYNKRIVCLAITAPDNQHFGKPSSWSAAIDQKLFGSVGNRNKNTLFVVSSGNLPLDDRLLSPLSNDDFPIQDPAQSFNAITVGSFTLKDRVDVTIFPGAELISERGKMSPCNSTSISWYNDWARKPDIVLEGGNDGIFNDGILDTDSLKLLSTGVGGIGRTWLTTFADTSASTALAAKLGAELYFKYPDLNPETIRGLIIHSADWTDQMLNNRPIEDLSGHEKRMLISRVGYGVPNVTKAKYSAENSLCLIAERELVPYKFEEHRVKSNKFHLFDLPWPTDILSDMAETVVTLKVTLSYFIEPNPGNKIYADSSTYQSHGLRFKMIGSTERPTAFKARISKVIRDEQTDYIKEGTDKWILGNKIRDKGSIHKDLWKGTAAELALRNKIAVFPVGGWWKNRKKLVRYNEAVKYSLIVSIETDKTDIDIYNPVLIEIQIPIELTNE